ncbi:MAG: hypothetical protein RL885_16460 [Planctomycetota bacterium]
MHLRVRRATFALLCLSFLSSTSISAQPTPDVSWLTSGTLDVGSPEAVARFSYEKTSSRPASLELPWATGVRHLARGVVTTEESFAVPIPQTRWGPVSGDLVLRRLWDTGQGAARIDISLDGRELGQWEIPELSGDRRWVHVYYVIPRPLWVVDGGEVPSSVRLRLRSARELPSYEYSFFVTSEWTLLGSDLAGSLQNGEPEEVTPEIAYVRGLVALGHRQLEVATKAFEKAMENPELAPDARSFLRRVRLRRRLDRLTLAGPQTDPRAAREAALYASANAFREEMQEAWDLAVSLAPTDPEATFHLAEALAANGRPVTEWAPLMERAGELWNRGARTNDVEVLVAIQTEAYPKMATDGPKLCEALSREDVEALTRDWRLCEQIVYGASRGMYRLRSTFRVDDADDPDWVMHLGWLFGPPDEVIPVRGRFDYSMCFAGYGSSHTGGVDCGTAGSAASQIGPRRGWEVFLHEWNHQFDWIAIHGEQLPGYPVTHDSDGCGQQPIPGMGVGHLSSMYYYVTPAEYRRHEGADPERPGAHLRSWSIGPIVTPKLSGEGSLESEIVTRGFVSEETITLWQKEWSEERERKPSEVTASPIEQVPPPKVLERRSWQEFLVDRWVATSLFDELGVPESESFLAGRESAGQPWTSEGDFVDLTAITQELPSKAIVLAETWVQAPLDREVRVWLGANDRAAVWINGRPILRGEYIATAKWEDASRTDMVAGSARLETGWNRIVVRAERLGGDFGFSLRLCGWNGEPIPGLVVQSERPDADIVPPSPPAAGKRYDWDQVRDDWRSLLPQLDGEELREITQQPIVLARHRFFVSGLSAFPGARVVNEPSSENRSLDNDLNWDREKVAAIRYWRGGELRDLVLIRPEGFEEYLTLGEVDGAWRRQVLGYWVIEDPEYLSTPNRTGRREVLIVDGKLPDRYPKDEQDLLRLER